MMPTTNLDNNASETKENHGKSSVIEKAKGFDLSSTSRNIKPLQIDSFQSQIGVRNKLRKRYSRGLSGWVRGHTK